MPGMKMPEWYGEAKASAPGVFGNTSAPMTGLRQTKLELEKITDLPYIFAEYSVKEGDVLLHLFPRAGASDTWEDGHYVNRCRNCNSAVEGVSGQKLKACPKCGHSGLTYIPGRAEVTSKLTFPADARDIIKAAVDKVWMGDVAIELVPELNAYVVQLQKAKNTAVTVGLDTFVRQICVALNSQLAPKN